MTPDPEFDSLVPAQSFDRRSFLVTSLGVGFALATQPVMAQTAIKTDEAGLLAGEIKVPALLLLLYGALRFSTALFTELREMLFARVTQQAVRHVALEVFRHLHSLALRFHLDRQTGGVSRGCVAYLPLE